MRTSFLFVASIFFATSCSGPSLKQSYTDADAHRKALLLATYPELTPEWRSELLTSRADPVSLLQTWKVSNNAVLSEPARFAPQRLVVETEAVLPVKTGRTLPVHAFLDYPGGKRVEVTQDVTWRAAPEVAWVHAPGRLDYECIAGTIEVSADFLNERAGRLGIPFAKPIKSLELGVAESSQVINVGETLKLKLQTYCEDGTQSDVSCQAQWKVDKDLGRLSGCGTLQIYSKEAIRDGVAEVTATYAGRTVTRQLRFKARASAE